jgi:hypothetical protein
MPTPALRTNQPHRSPGGGQSGRAARISDELDAWLQGGGDKTLGGLIEVFKKRAFAILFVLLVAGGAFAAFLAPPFTGLDTLPALGVVLVSLGVLLRTSSWSPLASSSAPQASFWRSSSAVWR